MVDTPAIVAGLVLLVGMQHFRRGAQMMIDELTVFEMQSVLHGLEIDGKKALSPANRKKLLDTFEGQKTLLTGTLQTFAVALPIAVGGCILGPAIIATVFGGLIWLYFRLRRNSV